MQTKDHFNIYDLRCFVEVIDQGSMSRAARALNRHQPRLSYSLRRLEEAFGAPLWVTDQREIRMTTAGQKVYDMARVMLDQHLHTLRGIESEKDGLRGRVTIATPSGFGSMWLMPRLADFHNTYPDIQVNVVLNDHDQRDMKIFDRVDICILTLKPSHSESIHYDILCEYRMGFYASKAYLETFGTPETADDLDHHRLISWANLPAALEPSFNKHLYIGRKEHQPRKSILSVQSSQLLKGAILGGAGIGGAVSDIILGSERKELHEINFLQDHNQNIRNKKYIMYQKDLSVSKRHQVFIEWLYHTCRDVQ